jgi:hypothetical protein
MTGRCRFILVYPGNKHFQLDREGIEKQVSNTVGGRLKPQSTGHILPGGVSQSPIISMQYIVKDLMISVLPLRPGDASKPDCLCTGCTGCTGNTNQTKAPACPGDFDLYAQVSNPGQLALLKQQLREALAAVEAREKVVLESLKPQSSAEVELLQAHLTAALEELKQRGNKPPTAKG